MSIHNVKITSTFLGIEDHGVMTFMIHLQSETIGIGYGGYGLDKDCPRNGESLGHGESRKPRIASSFGLGYQAIRHILETLNKTQWESLPQTLCRIEFNDGPGSSGKILRIGNILEDKWFDLQTYMRSQAD